MALDGFTGLWPHAMGNLADPDISALRVTFVSGGGTFQSATLLNAQNATGTGAVRITALWNGGGYGAGYWYGTCSGNSASATFLGSHDGTTYLPITSTAMGVGVTGTGQWSGYYPYLAARVDWVSGAANTGTVTLKLHLL